MTVLQLVKEFPSFSATRSFITFSTRSGHLSLSWARLIQSTLHPVTWKCVLVLFSHLLLGIPSGLLPSCLPARTRYSTHLSPFHAACPAHLIQLYLFFRTVFIEKNGTLSSSLCSLFHSLSPHPSYTEYVPSTLFSIIFNPFPSLSNRNTFPYRLTFQGKPYSNHVPQYSNSTTTSNARVAMNLLVIDQFPLYKTHIWF